MKSFAKNLPKYTSSTANLRWSGPRYNPRVRAERLSHAILILIHIVIKTDMIPYRERIVLSLERRVSDW